MASLTEDHAHVLLDAIAIARQQAPATNYSPWNDYDQDPYGHDDKANAAGWYSLLDEAKEALEELVGKGGEVEF